MTTTTSVGVERDENARKIAERADLLRNDLERAIAHYRRLAKNTYRMNAALMGLTVGLSLVAGIGGLSDVFGSKLVGLLAIFPGLLAGFSTTMKFQAKANQHYRRKDALQLLKNKLLFETPISVGEKDIAALSHEWGILTDKMNDEYEKTLQFDWAHFASDKGKRGK